MEDFSFLNQYPILQIILYIIIFVIGGVFYKYFRLLLEDKHVTQKNNADSNQLLILNMQERLNKMTENLEKLEKEKNEVHKRELQRERELAEAKAEVRILNIKLEHLEEAVKVLTNVVNEYEKKYGKLNDKED